MNWVHKIEVQPSGERALKLSCTWFSLLDVTFYNLCRSILNIIELTIDTLFLTCK